jgi:nucleoside-diphosphate-sugar epimerase
MAARPCIVQLSLLMESVRFDGMSRIALVTGGAGFIGSHLVDRLMQTGWAVRVLDNLTTGRAEHVARGAEFVHGDINDAPTSLDVCRGVDTVFHLAARVSVRDSFEFMIEHNTTNVTGTLVLLKAASATKVRRFVFASSMAVYSDSTAAVPLSETHATRPLSPYGIAKLATEDYLCLAAPFFDIEPVVLRFFNTYGTRQAFSPYVGVATIFINQLLAGQGCTIFGDGEQCRDFVHVSDLVAACVLAADAPRAAGRRINVGTGRGTTVNQLLSLIAASLGRAAKCTYEPRQASELRNSIADITVAKQLLGYEPRASVDDSITEIIAAIREGARPRMA